MNYFLWALVVVGAARFLGLLWHHRTGEPQVSIHAGQMLFGAWAAWLLWAAVVEKCHAG